jgi:hypothetical protein
MSQVAREPAQRAPELTRRPVQAGSGERTGEVGPDRATQVVLVVALLLGALIRGWQGPRSGR